MAGIMWPVVPGFIMEGEIMRRMSLLAVVVLVGCSAGKKVETGPVAARQAASVPQVISPPRPFRVADAAIAAARPEVAGDVATEIRAMLDGYLRDFNRHDSVAVAAHWSDRGESIDLASGEVTAGRTAVRDVFAALFATDADATIDIDVASVRPVRHDVAVVDGQTRLGFTDGGSAASRFSAVLVKQDGRWLVESLRESPLPAAEKTDGTARPLDELAWLLGAWEDVGEGVTASTQCFWSAGRAFIVRSHAVRPEQAPENLPAAGDTRIPGLLPADDSGPRELTEIIGFDPERQAIRSWIFASSGRFAEATWTKAGDSWTVRVEGRGRDEGAVCECTLERLGIDGLVVRCSSDALAELLPPACEFTRTARSE